MKSSIYDYANATVNVLSSSERRRMKIGEGLGGTEDVNSYNKGNFHRRPDPPKNSWWVEEIRKGESFKDALARETPRITGEKGGR